MGKKQILEMARGALMERANYSVFGTAAKSACSKRMAGRGSWLPSGTSSDIWRRGFPTLSSLAGSS